MASTASVVISEGLLCEAFQRTLLEDVAARKEAEDYLRLVRGDPRLLPLVIQVVLSEAAPVGIRTSAALFLKNEVRWGWRVSSSLSSAAEGPTAGVPTASNCYAEADKEVLRASVLPFLETLIRSQTPRPIVNTVQECIRVLVYDEFPLKWPGVLTLATQCIQQRNDAARLQAGVVTLKWIAESFSMRSTRGDDSSGISVASFKSACFAALLPLAAEISTLTTCFDTEESSLVAKLVCKIYQLIVTTACEEKIDCTDSLDIWMGLLIHLLSTPIPASVLQQLYASGGEEAVHTGQCFKAKRWALQIAHTFLYRFSLQRNFAGRNEAACKLGEIFLLNWAPEFVRLAIQMLHAERSGAVLLPPQHEGTSTNIPGSEIARSFTPQQRGQHLPDRLKYLILQFLAQSLESVKTYNVLFPEINFVLFDVCFEYLCYSASDLERWETDPLDFVVSTAPFNATPQEGAVEFLKSLIRFRARTFLRPVLDFVELVLSEYSAATASQRTALHNRRKDGALFMVGSLVDRLTSKKRQLDVEPFLSQHVLPELENSSDMFLRLRAAWTYRQFLDPETRRLKTFQQPELLAEAYLKMVNLCNDPELPVRVAAAHTLGGFFGCDVPAVRSAVEGSLAVVMERLFQLMAQVPSNENIVVTLELLVLNFESHVPPFAVQIVAYLAEAFVRLVAHSVGTAATGDENAAPSPTGSALPLSGTAATPMSVANSSDEIDDDISFTSMSISRAITTVLSTLTENKFSSYFADISPKLASLFDICFTPRAIDYLDEPLEMLTLISFYCPNLSQPFDHWRWYERMYQAMCGGSSSHLTCTGAAASGWAPDFFDKMVPSLDNFASRDKQRFATGISTLGRQFKELHIEILAKGFTPLVHASCRKSGAELLMLLFEAYLGTTGLIDDMVEPCLRLFFERMQQERTAMEVARQQHPAPSGGPVTRRKSRELQLGSFDSGIERTPPVLVTRTLAMAILYNSDLFFAFTEQTGVTEAAVDLLLQGATGLKSEAGLKVYVLCIARLLEVAFRGDTAPVRLPEAVLKRLPEATRDLINKQVPALQQVRAKASKAAANSDDESDDEFTDDDSEQDIGDHEDASPEVSQRIMKVLNAARANEKNTDDGFETDDEEEDSDASTFDNEADTDQLVERDSPLALLDDVRILETLVRSDPSYFNQVVGAASVEKIWKKTEPTTTP